jgi:glycosyltransferase involved in cell wall biosynthesis
MLDQITPLILTLDEAPNIARTLSRLAWARRVVVVDSGSVDGTRELLAQHPKVEVVARAFTSHAEQWNFGLHETGIDTEWVLALDADYVLSEELVSELATLAPPPDVSGWRARFRYCVEGVALRGAAYPPVTVLYRRALARYRQDGHTQRIAVPGRIETLRGDILHDDRKPLSHWLAAQSRYMRLEAEKLQSTPLRELSLADRVRRLVVVAPFVMFFYCLLVRGNILDGRRGLFYALQRAVAESILSLYLVRRAFDKAPR